MATAAFKSTPRRDTTTKGPPLSRRRSHSVNAVYRKTQLPSDERSSISTEFCNSRDNPLFSAASSKSSSPHQEDNEGTNEFGFSNNTQLNSVGRDTYVNLYRSASEDRGRSIARDGDVKKGIGRSLSRGRSYQDVVGFAGVQNKEPTQTGYGFNRTKKARNRVDTHARIESTSPKTFQSHVSESSDYDSACSLRMPNLEDEISTASLSEAEEKTIEAFCEDLDDFQRNYVQAIAASEVADIPPDMVNSGAVELVTDIRREYAIKLEQSEERARKLREDLAVEEDRGQELGRILKEILPDPKTSSAQKSRRGRRSSNERRRMSKRLTEEAMAYFDECVSLSTFDSSDFSAAEDPLFSSSVVKETPTSRLGGGYENDINFHQKQLFHSFEDSETKMNGKGGNYGDFSFANQQLHNIESYEGIGSSGIKHFERPVIMKDDDAESSSCTRFSYFDAGEYSMHDHAERMLIDKVLYSDRIDYGGLLLCGRAVSFPPFAW